MICRCVRWLQWPLPACGPWLELILYLDFDQNWSWWTIIGPNWRVKPGAFIGNPFECTGVWHKSVISFYLFWFDHLLTLLDWPVGWPISCCKVGERVRSNPCFLHCLNSNVNEAMLLPPLVDEEMVRSDKYKENLYNATLQNWPGALIWSKMELVFSSVFLWHRHTTNQMPLSLRFSSRTSLCLHASVHNAATCQFSAAPLRVTLNIRVRTDSGQRSLNWLRITEYIECKLLSLTYKVLTTTKPLYLHHLITVQSPRNTRSSSLVTFTHPSTSSFSATNAFRYASLYLWNQLSPSLVNLIPPLSSFSCYFRHFYCIDSLSFHHP